LTYYLRELNDQILKKKFQVGESILASIVLRVGRSALKFYTTKAFSLQAKKEKPGVIPGFSLNHFIKN